MTFFPPVIRRSVVNTIYEQETEPSAAPPDEQVAPGKVVSIPNLKVYVGMGE